MKKTKTPLTAIMLHHKGKAYEIAARVRLEPQLEIDDVSVLALNVPGAPSKLTFAELQQARFNWPRIHTRLEAQTRRDADPWDDGVTEYERNQLLRYERDQLLRVVENLLITVAHERSEKPTLAAKTFRAAAATLKTMYGKNLPFPITLN